MRFHRREGQTLSAGSAWTKIASYKNDSNDEKARVIAIGHCYHASSTWKITRDDGSFYIPNFDFQLGTMTVPFNVDFEVDPKRSIEVWARNSDGVGHVYEAVIVYEGTYDQRSFLGVERCETVHDWIETTPEFEMKQGRAFQVRAVASSLAAGGTSYTLAIQNPSGSGRTMYLYGILARGTCKSIILDFLKVATITGGTALTPINLKFGDSNASVMTCKQVITSFTGGDFLGTLASTALLVWFNNFPFLVLPPNTILLIEIYNPQTGADTFVVHAYWYEKA